jgi:hypothetical protein
MKMFKFFDKYLGKISGAAAGVAQKCTGSATLHTALPGTPLS